MRPDDRTIAHLSVLSVVAAALLILMGIAFAESWVYTHRGFRMTRIFDRLMDFMEPDEWYTTMDLAEGIKADNGNVYKVLKKAVRDGFIEKGPNRMLPWGMAAVWRLIPPSERSRSRKPLLETSSPAPSQHPYEPIGCVIHLYHRCITYDCHDVNGGPSADDRHRTPINGR